MGGGLINPDCGDEWTQAVDDFVFASCPTHALSADEGKKEKMVEKAKDEEGHEVEEAKTDPAMEETVALVEHDENAVKGHRRNQDRNRRIKKQKDRVKNRRKKAETKKQPNEKDKANDE